MKGGADAVADYELLEMILFSAHPRGDVKPLAKQLLAKFGSFAKVMTAEPQALLEVEEVGEASIAAIKVVQAAAERSAVTTAEPIWTLVLICFAKNSDA